MPEATNGNLLIFGASTRAAAFSALRAGLRPWCADLFADADLRARCPSVSVRGSYPEGFLDVLATAPPGPWMYTGGLENWQSLVSRMAQRRPLWGTYDQGLARARNPDFVNKALRRAGLPTPATRFDFCDLPPVFRWLVKPLHGAGGTGIHFFSPDGDTKHWWPRPVYYQEFIDGEPCAAIYAGDGRRACFLGLTRQLVGEAWLHAGPFHYCGSIGPLGADFVLEPALDQLGEVLGAACGLHGLFGVDGVLREGVFWPVEVNPRYTASVEVLEYATGLKSLVWHWMACALGRLPGPFSPETRGYVGKAYLFARADLVFPADGPWTPYCQSLPPVDELPAFADVPAAGTCFRARQPVLTFFARGYTLEACEAKLRQTAADLDRHLYER